jgi:hypothetical protein
VDVGEVPGPAHRPTAEARRLVQAAAELFLSHGGIGAILGLSAAALRQHYATELARGAALGELAVASGLRRLAERGNAAAVIYLAKAKLGWSEKSVEQAEDDGGRDTRAYLSMPEAERLSRLRALAARVLGPEPDPRADGFDHGAK